MLAKGRRNGEAFEEALDFHDCSHYELEAFPEPSSSSRSSFEKIKTDEKRGFKCLDAKDYNRLAFQNAQAEGDYTRLQLLFVPCNFLREGSNETVSDECIYKDLESQREFLGPLIWYIYHPEDIL